MNNRPAMANPHLNLEKAKIRASTIHRVKTNNHEVLVILSESKDMAIANDRTNTPPRIESTTVTFVWSLLFTDL
jgi:hypothetical protein